MSEPTAVAAYIRQKLKELDQQKDQHNLIWKGELSFGIDSTTYGHLPAWKDAVRKKKTLKWWVWLDAFFLSLIIVVVSSDLVEKFQANWLKALLGLALMTVLVMLFYVVSAFYNLFVQFRQVEREVRKLIYQDLLEKLEKEKEIPSGEAKDMLIS